MITATEDICIKHQDFQAVPDGVLCQMLESHGACEELTACNLMLLICNYELSLMQFWCYSPSCRQTLVAQANYSLIYNL